MIMNPHTWGCIYSSEPNKVKQALREEYRFYLKVLRVIYPKKKLRDNILKELIRIEKTDVHSIPPAKGSSVMKSIKSQEQEVI